MLAKCRRLPDSFFLTFSDFAGNVIQDDLIGYGPIDNTHTISYTFDGSNGFSAGVAVEEGYEEFTLDSYVPHVTGGVNTRKAGAASASWAATIPSGKNGPPKPGST